MFGNATAAAGAGTSGASSPFNANPYSSGQYYGLITDNTCRWFFLGVAETAIGTKPIASTVTPAAPSDVMDGYMASVLHANMSTLGLTQVVNPATAQTENDKTFHYTGGPFSFTTGAPRVLGPSSGTLASPSYVDSDKRPVVEFITDARWVGFRPEGPVRAASSYLIEVNGRLLNINPYRPAADLTNGGFVLDLSTFSGKKTVRIYCYQDIRSNLMYTVYIGPLDSIYPPKNANRFSIAIESDSIGRGAYTSPIFPGKEMEAELANRIGCDHWYGNGVGGTGVLNDASGTRTTYIQRLDRIVSFNPDILVVMGNHNDASISTGDPGSAARQAGIVAYLQAVRAALPNTTIFITDPFLLQSDNSATGIMATCSADVAAAVTTLTDANVIYVPLYAQNGPWPYGTGAGVFPQGNGNKDRYYYKIASVYVDAHPVPTFYPHVADLLANVINNWANS